MEKRRVAYHTCNYGNRTKKSECYTQAELDFYVPHSTQNII